MTYTVTFDREHKLVRVTADGSENMTVALESMHNLHIDPRFQPDYGILCDFRKQKFVPNAMDASGLGTLLRGFFAGQKMAFVISDAKHIIAQQLVIAAAKSEVNAMVFSDLPAAENWLKN